MWGWGVGGGEAQSPWIQAHSEGKCRVIQLTKAQFVKRLHRTKLKFYFWERLERGEREAS